MEGAGPSVCIGAGATAGMAGLDAAGTLNGGTLTGEVGSDGNWATGCDDERDGTAGKTGGAFFTTEGVAGAEGFFGGAGEVRGSLNVNGRPT